MNCEACEAPLPAGPRPLGLMAVWCAVCRREMPGLVGFLEAEERRARGAAGPVGLAPGRIIPS